MLRQQAPESHYSIPDTQTSMPASWGHDSDKASVSMPTRSATSDSDSASDASSISTVSTASHGGNQSQEDPGLRDSHGVPVRTCKLSTKITSIHSLPPVK